jgi:hypothetical protein
MFHWICPECGQEIAPGVKECPLCEPHTSAPPPPVSAQPAPEKSPLPPVADLPTVVELQMPVAALAGRVDSPKPVVRQSAAMKQSVVEEPPPAPAVVLQPQVVLKPRVVLQPPAVLQPQVAVPPQAVETPRVVLEAISAEARSVAVPRAPLGVASEPLRDDVTYEAAEPETFADRLADLAEHLHAERIPYLAQQITPGTFTSAGTARAPMIIDVVPEKPSPDAPPSMLLLAEPQPPSMAAEIPIEQVFQPGPSDSPARARAPLGAESSTPEPVQLPERSNYTAAPALAPLQDYSEAADRQMRPAGSEAKASQRTVEPKVSLPGPALPRELTSLQAAGLVPIRRGGKHATAGTNPYSSWTMRAVVVGILLTAGLAATYTLMPSGTSSPTSAPPRPTPNPAPDPPVSARSANSLTRFVEVTGIRFMEVNKKPQIQYLVVNHSGAPMSSVMIYVTLRATNAKPGQPPIARLTFRSPALEGFEAKEMFSSIEKTSAPLDLPDWQDLHADVEVQ